jgi:ribosomal-protein-alanine N-acetyltransferase
VYRTLGGFRSREQISQTLPSYVAHWDEQGFGYYVWLDRETGELVGRGGLRIVEIAEQPEVELGWATVADRWGEGLATEAARAFVEVAFNQLGLDDVVAFTMPDNGASRRVMAKLDMTYERDIVWADLPHVLYRLERP